MKRGTHVVSIAVVVLALQSGCMGRNWRRAGDNGRASSVAVLEVIGCALAAAGIGPYAGEILSFGTMTPPSSHPDGTTDPEPDLDLSRRLGIGGLLLIAIAESWDGVPLDRELGYGQASQRGWDVRLCANSVSATYRF
jgi:hypothetical protein